MVWKKGLLPPEKERMGEVSEIINAKIQNSHTSSLIFKAHCPEKIICPELCTTDAGESVEAVNNFPIRDS